MPKLRPVDIEIQKPGGPRSGCHLDGEVGSSADFVPSTLHWPSLSRVEDLGQHGRTSLEQLEC